MNAASANGLKHSVSTFWSDRNQRERNMLMAAIAVIVLGAIYALLIDPALSGRTDLEKKLPTLRQQAAEVQALSKETSALTGKSAPSAAVMTRESIEASLTRNGLKAQNITVSGELAKVQLNANAFSGIVDWLTDLQKTARVSVVDAVIESQAQPDTVNANLTLRQQRSE